VELPVSAEINGSITSGDYILDFDVLIIDTKIPTSTNSYT